MLVASIPVSWQLLESSEQPTAASYPGKDAMGWCWMVTDGTHVRSCEVYFVGTLIKRLEENTLGEDPRYAPAVASFESKGWATVEPLLGSSTAPPKRITFDSTGKAVVEDDL